MGIHLAVKYMVVTSMCFVGNTRQFTEYPLSIVDDFEDVVPSALFKHQSKKALFSFLGGREYFTEDFIGDRSWGKGVLFYIKDDFGFFPLGIVRGGVGLDPVVYVNYPILEKIVYGN